MGGFDADNVSKMEGNTLMRWNINMWTIKTMKKTNNITCTLLIRKKKLEYISKAFSSETCFLSTSHVKFHSEL